MKPLISAIIHTLNEESNIGNALDSVMGWADECIVIDMHSEDRTVEIAEAKGARVFLHERCGSADPARMFAENQAVGEWIFILDADEIAPLELTTELLRISDNDIADICLIPRLNYFAGAPLLASGWGPAQDLQIRFYRKGWIILSPLIHTKAKFQPGSRVLNLQDRPGWAIVHFNYLNAEHFLNKLNRYTTIEAFQGRENGQKVSSYDLIVRPLLEFINRYVRRGGFRDGWAGFYYCFMMLVYRMTQAMKLHELKSVGDASSIQSKYQHIAEQLNAQRADATAGKSNG
jgi:glycosyltransferase involved in cell wall biosynthesis